MTITQIEYLLAVINCGSFSAATQKCFVTQPSLSTQIKNLEEELGVTLLDRSSKPIVPTEIGKLLVEQMNRSLSEFYAIKERVHEQMNEIKGTLTLAVIPTISPYVLHKFVPQFAKRYKGIKVEVKEMYTYQIERALLNGSVDIGMLAGGFLTDNQLSEEVLYSDKLYLYVSKKHPFYGKKEVNPSEINVNELLLLPDGHCLRSQILNLCDGQIYHKGDVLFESGSLETIMRMVDNSDKMTIIPQMMIPFINNSAVNQVIPLSKEVNAKREITFAINNNFYKRGIYDALKQMVIEATEFDSLINL